MSLRTRSLPMMLFVVLSSNLLYSQLEDLNVAPQNVLRKMF
jgi:hypothetical protein